MRRGRLFPPTVSGSHGPDVRREEQEATCPSIARGIHPVRAACVVEEGVRRIGIDVILEGHPGPPHGLGKAGTKFDLMKLYRVGHRIWPVVSFVARELLS